MHTGSDEIMIDYAADLIRSGMRAPDAAKQALIDFGTARPTPSEVSEVCRTLQSRSVSSRNRKKKEKMDRAAAKYRKTKGG